MEIPSPAPINIAQPIGFINGTAPIQLSQTALSSRNPPRPTMPAMNESHPTKGWLGRCFQAMAGHDGPARPFLQVTHQGSAGVKKASLGEMVVTEAGVAPIPPRQDAVGRLKLVERTTRRKCGNHHHRVSDSEGAQSKRGERCRHPPRWLVCRKNRAVRKFSVYLFPPPEGLFPQPTNFIGGFQAVFGESGRCIPKSEIPQEEMKSGNPNLPVDLPKSKSDFPSFSGIRSPPRRSART